MEHLIFWSLAGATILGALGVVTLRNTLHSALMLGLCLFGVAGLFATLGADFLFASQILIYVGGIAVLILFVVLLAGRASDLLARQINARWPAALMIAGAMLWGLWAYVVAPYVHAGPASQPAPTTAALGDIFLGDLALPFELISLVLLAALAGAVIFSKTETEP